jgi:hypothetical protein
MKLQKNKPVYALRTLFTLLFFTSVSCGQVAREPVSKDQALRGVKVSNATGWKEAVSDRGHFRILFPGEPTVVEDGEPAGLQGYKLITGEKNWVSYRYDYPEPKSDDETQIRGAYRRSVEAITQRRGAKLLRQSDVRLNGWLGAEFVIESPGAISYMRAFHVHGRLFTLSVDVKQAGEVNPAVPPDVQQFFDSFTFWD